MHVLILRHNIPTQNTKFADQTVQLTARAHSGLRSSPSPTWSPGFQHDATLPIIALLHLNLFIIDNLQP